MEELEGTKLLSLGARLQKSLLIKTPSDAETTRLFALLQEQSAQKFNKKLDVDSYLSQAEKSNQTIEEFGRYTLLILCVCLGFAAVSLYTGVARYFEAVQPALSITRLLGMSSWQQVGVFLMGGALLWALSSLVAFGIGQSIIFFVRRFPEAASFQMLPDPIMFSFSVTAGGIFIVLAPQVYRCLRS
jgi:predicted lysophospholipase L1 biosynthesis ABC-type transport system permease subunit